MELLRNSKVFREIEEACRGVADAAGKVAEVLEKEHTELDYENAMKELTKAIVEMDSMLC